MVLITIVNVVYKPTYDQGGPHCMDNTLWLFNIAMEAMAHRNR